MKITLNGQLMEVERMEFATLKEPWSEYQLTDGTIIRVKTVLTQVFKTDQRDDMGLPMFSFKSQLLAAVDQPEQPGLSSARTN